MKAHRMDQETVERLLGGPVVDPQDGTGPLALLLTAVRAAPRAGELAGEDAAVRAYQSALAGSPLAVPALPGRRLLRPGFGIRAALAGTALAATGGVAFAAAAGTLPNPLRDPAPASPPASAPASVASPTTAPGQRSTPAGGAGDGRPEPAESVARLCRAYQADADDDPGRTLDNPVFGDLIGAAGGRDAVGGYCDRVLADDRDGPDPHGSPAGRPSAAPPAGGPSVRPSAAPPTPTQRPTTPRSGSASTRATPTVADNPDHPERTVPPTGGGRD